MTKKIYERSYKLAAVNLVLEQKQNVYDVCKKLNLHPNTLYRWINEFLVYKNNAFPGHASAILNTHYENKKLKEENETLKKEIIILKEKLTLLIDAMPSRLQQEQFRK